MRGEVQACGQFAREADLVGLYDVYTRDSGAWPGAGRRCCAGTCWRWPPPRARRWPTCRWKHDNHGARRIYERLGFSEGYRYHYRQAPP